VWREDDDGRRRLKTSFHKAPIVLDASAAGQAGAFIQYQQPVNPKDRRFAGRYPDGSRRPWLGEFADMLVITGALWAAEVGTAAEMAGMLGVAWPDADPDPVTRLRAELAALVQCYRRLRAMCAELGVRPDRLRSTGSLGGAALDTARVVPLAVKPIGLALIVKGAYAGTFQGGTVMALDTHTLRHAALGDRSGDFPRIFSAGGWQDFLTCEQIEAHSRDPAELARLLADPHLPDRLRTDRALFRRLSRTVVLAHPSGELAPAKVEGRPGDYSLHVGPLRYDGDLPLLGLDLAVTALAGPVTEIVAAWELVPLGCQQGLRPLPLPTGRPVNLLTEDLGQVLVEERERVKHDGALPSHERVRLLSLLKLFSNAMVFGIFAREDREHLAHPVEVTAYDHHGKPHTVVTDRPPRPGPWCWLPLASAIEAGSRLITALTMYDLENAGLRCLHVCVDAVLVETPDQQAREVLADIFAGFDPLLAPTGPPAWKQEADSLSEPTLAYVAGTNKVVLLRPDREGRLRVVRSTDTGLGGHIADPVYGEELLPDGHHRWTAEYLAPVVEAAENFSLETGWPVPVLPAEAQRPVLRRLRATTPAQLRRLRRAFPDEEVRPWDFYLRADTESGPVYALGEGHDPAQWMALDWRRATGRPATLTTSDFYRPAGSVRVRSVAEYLDDWHVGAGDELSEPIEDQGAWPWPQRGPRRLVPVYSTPGLTDLVSREGERLSLRDADPDADIAESQLTYGSLIEPAELVERAWKIGPTQAARWTELSRKTLDGLFYEGRHLLLRPSPDSLPTCPMPQITYGYVHTRAAVIVSTVGTPGVTHTDGSQVSTGAYTGG
jgi:hypothetical protein